MLPCVMCELFGMSSLEPATVRMSFERFAEHGGGTAHHADGWGIGYYEESDVRLVREPEPAAHSACARLVSEQNLAARLVVAHIRKATQGERALRNTQPFGRELGGRIHLFAHNGQLERLAAALPLGSEGFRPVGETDSEHAFCSLLNALRPLWRTPGSPPDLGRRLEVLSDVAARLRELGPANFLYSDGDALFAHGDARTQHDGAIRPPGLYALHRACAMPASTLEVPGLRIESGAAAQKVVLLASVPLSDESWVPLERGELLAISDGRVLRRVP